MSTATIRRRLDDLQAARARQERKGKGTYLDDMRKMLEGVDGQAEIGTIPDEGLYWEMTRRMETAEGYSLALMPGDTIKEKRENVEQAHHGKLAVSPEARHAARGYFALYDGL